MSQRRSKLLLLEGTPGEFKAIQSDLERHVDVTVGKPESINAVEWDLVLSGADALALVGDAAHETLLSRIFDSVQAGACLFDESGAELWSSVPFKRLPEDIRQQVYVRSRAWLVDTDDKPAEISETPFLTWESSSSAGPDGHVRHFRASLSGVHGGAAGGSAPLFVVVVRDITAARRRWDKISQIERAGRRLLQMEVDTVRKLNAAERLGLLEQRISRSAHELLEFDHFAVRLLDQETGKIEIVMSVGLPPEAGDCELYARDKGNGISGYVAATGRSYLCNDVTKDERYVIGLRHAGSSITVPLWVGDRIKGVFNVERAEKNRFTENDLRFAEIFSQYVSMALHILDLLVVEQFTTNEAMSGTMQGEVSEPLEDLAIEAEWLKEQGARDPETARHVDRILRDVNSIRRRIQDVASGPRTILGAEKALRESGPEPAFVDRRILIADDEPAIRETIEGVLSRRGCVVDVCESGRDAIALLEDEDTPSFDLVISDIKMPDRNGYEVFSSAKKQDADLPVILMTGFGYDPHHSIVRASQEGLHCVLFKPFQVERLLDEVRKALKPAAED